MPILGIVASSISGNLWPTNSFESIASYTATGNITSYTFNSIPSTYQHLQLRCLSRRDTGVGHLVVLQFNGDTSSNYWWHLLEGDGATLSASSVSVATNRINAYWPNKGTNLANQFGPGIIDIHNYANTSMKKVVRCIGGGDSNGSGAIDFSSGIWNSTAAINSITISFSSDTVVANSKFALYGIKGA